MIAHSSLGPSGAKRWMNCPGSVRLCAGVPKPPASEYAAEGTVAHALAEEYATGAIDYLDLASRVGNVISQDGFEIEVTDEMVDGAALYSDTIDADRRALQGSDRPAPVVGKAETRVHASDVDERVWGTADFFLWQVGHKLFVYDYKFGKGVVVEAEANEQGALYLLGAAKTFKLNLKAFEEIQFVIVQPRAPHADGAVRRWRTSATWLEQFAVRARAAAQKTLEEDAPLAAGDWCRWCPAKAQCPAMHQAAMTAAQADFADAPPEQAIAKMEARLPEARLMTDAQLVQAFRWEDIVNSFFEAVKEVLRERLSSGQAVAGVKLVEGRSVRQWADEARVVQAFKAELGEKLYEKKLLSPAKLEKIVGKGRLVSPDGADLTVKPEGKKAVALESDPRPAAKSSAHDDFGVVLTGTTCPECEILGTCSRHKKEAVGAASTKKSIWP